MPIEAPLDASAEEVKATLLPLRSGVSLAIVRAGNAFAVGAMIRVAHSYLVREIILIGDAPFYEKASMGMHRFENIINLPDEVAFLEHVGQRPVYAIEKDHARRSLHEVTCFPDDVVLVLGSERFGIPAVILGRADDILAIPMYGVNHSFPVTVACGIVLDSWSRTYFCAGSTR